MEKTRAITQENFDKLLAWLDPDRETAGRKYETIRQRLIKIFACRGCYEAEDLADETINRVTLKIQDVSASYVGEPALYFYGVANKIYLESFRKPHPEIKLVIKEEPKIEHEYDCLEKCLQQLNFEQRQLILDYYQDEKSAKIDHRRQLAEKMAIAPNALRIKAHRIRHSLQQCVQKCVEHRES
ncbi:MAG: hypothetical protein NVSMB56_12720 [Pyrinomonadaceae bacterium]